MRLLYTTKQPQQGRTLSRFLANEGIENQFELTKDSDWGSDGYGDAAARIWVIDEDLYDKAREWTDLFEKDPSSPVFTSNQAKAIVYPTILPADTRQGEAPRHKTGIEFLRDLRDKKAKAQGGASGPGNEQIGPITRGFLLLCCIIFLITTFTEPHPAALPENLPYAPFTMSQISKESIYDYPEAYVLVDRLINLYGVDKLLNPETLPPEGKIILAEAQKTPYWNGFYSFLVEKFKTGESPAIEAPLFEKIRQGEVWRVFTPCLLHSDFLHILFNMIWLIVLGKQIEQRLSPRRYLFFILIVGIVSNTCQYFMSGPNFIGFSGVVCGMVAFIWMRQRIAPWEGYPISQATIGFLFYFICAMLAIQLVGFFMEINGNNAFAPGIANTAHFAGAVAGLILARSSFFAWKGTRSMGPRQ